VTAPAERRALARKITRVANASVAEALSVLEGAAAGDSHRIAVTGAPGAGKSTLITGLVQHRLQSGAAERLAVLAVDPSSPVSGGSLLGDRIRMDAIADLPGLFIRSLPSRAARNGLCDNVEDVLELVESHAFPEIIFETVGVGQSEVDVRTLVDTVVLVVPPDAGDSIQTMKARIIEIADIFAVNRCENPRARRMASDINAILDRATLPEGRWRPPVLLTESSGTGMDALSGAITAHGVWRRTHENREERTIARRHYHLKSLLSRRIDEVLAAAGDRDLTDDLKSSYNQLLVRLPVD
jgi:LAO/AO transport system kinase